MLKAEVPPSEYKVVDYIHRGLRYIGGLRHTLGSEAHSGF